MPRILLVKTSSLGDVVHNFPVVSDIRSAMPDAQIDWVVEESFAALPRLHPGVSRVIESAVRRWRRSAWTSATRTQIAAFLAALRAERYDAIIDTQGLLKSAMIARAARGTRYGLDWRSSREPLRVFYDRTYSVPRRGHAVERNRKLAACVLGYRVVDAPSYGVRAERRAHAWLPEGAYAACLHATSARTKLWPESSWIELGAALSERGYTVVLPWGSEEEGARSARLAAAVRGAVVPPRLPLDELASLLGAARCAVGVDTGLTHLAAALEVPTVGVYTATDPALTGVYGANRATNVGGAGSTPAPSAVLAALSEVLA